VNYPGQLTVLSGPMFSGKTEKFIDRAIQFPSGQRAVYKPVIDTRHGDGYIQSHGGRRISAKWVDLKLEHIEPAPNLFIDEAQFLDPNALGKIQSLIQAGYSITLAGLDLDYRGQPFGLMPHFFCLADEVIKLSGKCARCPAQSTRTYRKIKEEGTVLVGGADSYEARCLKCFLQQEREGSWSESGWSSDLESRYQM